MDHVWNLILNGVLDVLNTPSGYFNTHDECNRSFKSDKVFTPNIGLWNKIYRKGGEGPYVWPGSKYGMEGIKRQTRPYGGWRVFTIGYIKDQFRNNDYSTLGVEIDKKSIKESEGLNHSGIKKKNGKIMKENSMNLIYNLNF